VAALKAALDDPAVQLCDADGDAATFCADQLTTEVVFVFLVLMMFFWLFSFRCFVVV
jgi:hypothetical protein